MLYQYIITIVAIFSIIVIFMRFRRSRTSLKNLIFWIVLWGLILFFAFTPALSSHLANFFGIGRGLDLILIFAVVTIFYLIFRIYITIEKIDSNITKVVSSIALNEEEKRDKLKKIEKELDSIKKEL